MSINREPPPCPLVTGSGTRPGSHRISTPAADAATAMPPADPAAAPRAMPMARRRPAPLGLLNQPVRGVRKARVNRHRVRAARRQSRARPGGGDAEESAHHRAAVNCFHPRSFSRFKFGSASCRGPCILLAAHKPGPQASIFPVLRSIHLFGRSHGSRPA
jgi:hypothetical protein